jgi:transcription elongation GreA/GreB family factor|tara:strand:+ start:24610 stop:24996 length:387 start_codon:yes stop_codon:yes gene_type:complete
MKKFITVAAIFLTSTLAIAGENEKDLDLLQPECQEWWTQNCTTMTKATYDRMQKNADDAFAELDREIVKMEAREQAIQQSNDAKTFLNLHFGKEAEFEHYQSQHDKEHKLMLQLMMNMNEKLGKLTNN